MRADLVEIESNEIVIRIPIDALPIAAGIALDRAFGCNNYVVSDPQVLAQSMLTTMRRENEIGDTLVTDMLDKVIVEIVEQGEEGIDEL